MKYTPLDTNNYSNLFCPASIEIIRKYETHEGQVKVWHELTVAKLDTAAHTYCYLWTAHFDLRYAQYIKEEQYMEQGMGMRGPVRYEK